MSQPPALEQQQPPPPVPPADADGSEVVGNGPGEHEDDNDERPHHLTSSGILEEENEVASPGMTDSELVQVHADVYGRKPPEIEFKEERLAAMEREFFRLPPDDQASVHKALLRNPLLFTSPQTTSFLQSEGWDARSAAERLATYWARREAFFGDLAFDDDVFTKLKTEDFLRYYAKSIRVSEDPDVDATSREIAQRYLGHIHESKIKVLDQVLEGTPMHQKAELLDAQRRLPELAGSDEHKLMFLRSEDLNEALAAKRMLRYWKMKYELFGSEVAHRTVTTDDLRGHELEMERLGYMRVMPGTDEFGRSIVAVFPERLWLVEGWTEERRRRAFWYAYNEVIERPNSQRNGIILMVDGSYGSHGTRLAEYKPTIQFDQLMLFNNSPVKVRAVHVYFGSYTGWKRMLAQGLAVLGSMALKRRVGPRVVAHCGAGDEVLLELQMYGISADQVPVEFGGQVGFT